jgi:allantoate deiminase
MAASSSPTPYTCWLQISKWMTDAGMLSWVDVIGNVHGYLNASDAEAPGVMMGSHYDTIVDAGK